MNRETFIDRDSVYNTITSIAYNTGGSTSRVEREDSLDGNVECGNVKGLEHEPGHLFSVDLGVKRGLSEEDWVLIWGNSELSVEGVVPDTFHIIPIPDDSVLNRVADIKDSSLLLSLISKILVLLFNSDKD